jgi:hypothetical protein
MDYDFDKKFEPADPRKAIVDPLVDDRLQKSRRRLERKFIKRIFVKINRERDYIEMVRYGRERYDRSMPNFDLFLERHPQFPIKLYPGVYGWIFKWSAWDLLKRNTLQNSQLFKEFDHVDTDANPDTSLGDSPPPVGIVFKIRRHGLFVLHNWKSSEFLKNTSYARTTFPVKMGVVPEMVYLEPFDSLLEDIGDSWFV